MIGRETKNGIEQYETKGEYMAYCFSKLEKSINKKGKIANGRAVKLSIWSEHFQVYVDSVMSLDNYSRGQIQTLLGNFWDQFHSSERQYLVAVL